MKLMYANEKLYDAVRLMATSRKSLKERISLAFNASLGQLTVEQNRMLLPPDLRAKFAEIEALCKGKNAEDPRGSVRASLDEISDDDAHELATKIFDLYYQVHARHEVEKGRV